MTLTKKVDVLCNVDVQFDYMVFQGHFGLIHADHGKTPGTFWGVVQDYTDSPF